MSEAPMIEDPDARDLRSNQRRDTLRVLALGAGLRLAAVVALHQNPVGLRDPLLYQRFAQGIARGDGYQSFGDMATAYYPPGYPFFLGGVQWVADRLRIAEHMPLMASLCQVALGTVAIAAVIDMGNRLRPDWAYRGRYSLGTLAGLLVAVWPNLILHTVPLLSETLYLAVFSWCIAVVLRLWVEPQPGLSRQLAAGGLLGLSALIRPQVLLITPVLLVAAFGHRARLAARLRALAVIGLTTLVVLTPWTIRNWTVFDGFVAISTNGGDNLCVGFHPGAGGGFEIPSECDTGEFYVDGPAAEFRRNAETARRARTWALHNPGALPELSARKLWFTYRHDHDGLRAVEDYEANRFLAEPARRVLRWLSDLYYYAVMAAAVVGVVQFARRGGRSPQGVFWAITITSLLVPVLFFGDARFKVPAMTLVGVAAALGLASLAGDSSRHAPAPDEPSHDEPAPAAARPETLERA